MASHTLTDARAYRWLYNTQKEDVETGLRAIDLALHDVEKKLGLLN